jgi:hypothetical protein
VIPAEGPRIDCVVDLQERDLAEVIPLFPKSVVWWIMPVAALGLAFARGAVYGDVVLPAAMTLFAVGSTLWHFWRRVRWPQQVVAEHGGVPLRFHFDDAGFGVESKLGQARLPWTAALEASELPGCFAIFTDTRNALIVPKRVMSPEQAAQLGALLRARVPQKLNRFRAVVFGLGIAAIYVFVVWKMMQL